MTHIVVWSSHAFAYFKRRYASSRNLLEHLQNAPLKLMCLCSHQCQQNMPVQWTAAAGHCLAVRPRI